MFHWLLGLYRSCPAAQLITVASYFNVNKSFSATTQVTLYYIYGVLASLREKCDCGLLLPTTSFYGRSNIYTSSLFKDILNLVPKSETWKDNQCLEAQEEQEKSSTKKGSPTWVRARSHTMFNSGKLTYNLAVAQDSPIRGFMAKNFLHGRLSSTRWQKEL